MGPEYVLIGASALTWLIAAAMTLLLAIWLARCGWNVPVVRQLVFFLLTLAAFDVANGVSLGGTGLNIPWQILPAATILIPAAALSFFSAYQAKEGRRRLTLPLWGGAVALIAFTMVFPEIWASVQNGKVVFGPVVALYGLNYLIFAIMAFELTRDAVKEEDDSNKRRSMLWLALGFSFLPAYVATSDFFFVDVLNQQEIPGLFLNIAHYLSVLAGLVLVAMFILLARAAIRTEADEQKVDVAWFMVAVIGPALTVGIQMLFIAFNAFDDQMSVAVEGVWAMLFPMFAAFAVARYHSFGMTTDSRPGLRIMLFALLFPMAFGLGWMAGKNSFPDMPTYVVGLIFVGLMLPFVKVFWQMAYVWSCKILGREPDPEMVGGDYVA